VVYLLVVVAAYVIMWTLGIQGLSLLLRSPKEWNSGDADVYRERISDWVRVREPFYLR
jgi:hypothetical protein